MGSKNRLRGIMKAMGTGMKASEVWQDFKSKLGLIQEMFTGISFQEKHFGRPEMNNNNKKKMKKEEGQELYNLEELKGETTLGKTGNVSLGKKIIIINDVQKIELK